MKNSNHIKNIAITGLFLFICSAFISCKKNWLDAKPVQSLVVPSTVQDYQALLDNTQNGFNYKEPALGELCSDDHYLLYTTWQARQPIEQNCYIWSSNVYQGSTTVTDWNNPFTQILQANIVLDGISKISPNSASLDAWNNVKGGALFFRAFNYFNLTQVFCKQYNSTTASNDLGLPIRTSNLIERIPRASLQNTYAYIINDLQTAITLLPATPLYPTRPAKGAAYGLLARIYLSMMDYTDAEKYASLGLDINSQLIDYNTLDSTATYPIPAFNKEVIFHCILNTYSTFANTRQIVDSTLYSTYGTNDLRRSIFFRSAGGHTRIWANYAGEDSSYPVFCGVATDELYLIKAECEARNDAVADAMSDLNKLLSTRFKTGTFVPLAAATSANALSQILSERRKELIFRGLRWSDLRRLNTDPAYAVTLTRVLNGQTYTLSPNDKRYVIPIPPNEISAGGVQQNP